MPKPGFRGQKGTGSRIRIRNTAARLAFISALACRFSQVCEVLLSTLGRHAESQNVALLRGLLGCLSVLLRLQPPALWTQLPEVGRTFQSLLAYTAHTKPKLRKVNIQFKNYHTLMYIFLLSP
jgi:hypothetical protein